MSKPWEQYQGPDKKPAPPWEQYQTPPPETPVPQKPKGNIFTRDKSDVPVLGPLQNALTNMMELQTEPMYNPDGSEATPILPGPLGFVEDKQRRLIRALGQGVAGVGEAVGDVIPEGVKQGLAKTMAWMEENKKGSIYEGASYMGGLREIASALPATLEQDSKDAAATLAFAAPTKLVRTNIAKSDLGGLRTAPKTKLDRTMAAQRRADIEKKYKPDNPLDYGEMDELGALGRVQYTEVKPFLKEVWDAVEDVPGVNPRKSNLNNRNAVKAEVTRLRKNLDESLLDADDITSDAIERALQGAEAKALEIPTVVGSAEATATKTVGAFRKLLKDKVVDGKIRPKDLLDIRRQLDQYLPKTLTEGGVGASEAVTALRQAINDLVAASSKSVDVKASLQRQSRLLWAEELMRGRSKTSGTVFGRMIEKIEDDWSLGAPQTPLAAAANLGSPAALALAGTAGALSMGARGTTNLLRQIPYRGAQAIDWTSPAAYRSVIASLAAQEQEK